MVLGMVLLLGSTVSAVTPEELERVLEDVATTLNADSFLVDTLISTGTAELIPDQEFQTLKNLELGELKKFGRPSGALTKLGALVQEVAYLHEPFNIPNDDQFYDAFVALTRETMQDVADEAREAIPFATTLIEEFTTLYGPLIEIQKQAIADEEASLLEQAALQDSIDELKLKSQLKKVTFGLFGNKKQDDKKASQKKTQLEVARHQAVLYSVIEAGILPDQADMLNLIRSVAIYLDQSADTLETFIPTSVSRDKFFNAFAFIRQETPEVLAAVASFQTALAAMQTSIDGFVMV